MDYDQLTQYPIQRLAYLVTVSFVRIGRLAHPPAFALVASVWCNPWMVWAGVMPLTTLNLKSQMERYDVPSQMMNRDNFIHAFFQADFLFQ